MKSTEELTVVVDTSGSMAEGAKLFIARGLVIKISQHSTLGYSMLRPRLYSWSNELKPNPWNSTEGYPELLMVAEGSASAPALVSHFQNSTENILLITDGYLECQDLSTFKEWEKTREENSIRIIQLSEESERNKYRSPTHHADDLIPMLHSWCPGQRT